MIQVQLHDPNQRLTPLPSPTLLLLYHPILVQAKIFLWPTTEDLSSLWIGVQMKMNALPGEIQVS